MNDSSKHVLGAEASRLAGLMDPAAAPVWRPSELGAVFRHQMSAPVDFDLAGFSPELAQRIRLLARSQGLLIRSFHDLIQHPSPPLDLLVAVKDFAKRAVAGRDEVLPRGVARMLYYLAIASALVKCGQRITTLKRGDLTKGFDWALDQEWLDGDNRRLLEEAAQLAKGSREDAT